MANGYLLGAPKLQLLDNAGAPLAGGKLHCYSANSTTRKDTWSNVGMTVPTLNANPVVMDAYGRPDSGAVYLTPEASYKFVCADADDVELWTQDYFVVPAVPT